MSVNIAFESTTLNQDQTRETVKVSYYSNLSKADLEDFIDFRFPPGKSSSRGIVENVHYYQKGPFWYCDVNCSTTYESGLLVSWGHSAPQNHSLQSILISLPLEKKSGYRAKWDHYLWVRLPSSASSAPTIPSVWSSAATPAPFKDTVENTSYYYRWTKTGDELDGAPRNGFYWKCVAAPTKPGVESFDRHTYQITEYGEYPDEAKAAWITAILLDRIRSAPLLGDFGLGAKLGSGWNWKCEDASVQYNGQKWVAQMTWTLSGDSNGWDTDLYTNASV